MANKGKLYLIPNIIADNTQDQIVTPQLREILPSINHFVAENIRTARRFLSSLKVYPSIEPLHFETLDKDTPESQLTALLKPLFDGHNLGVISESGCPGIADPGALAVQYAHQQGIQVVPLVGASSIILALMASGLNGQHFAFHGYLPVDSKDASSAIKNFERESKSKHQTQIFIETPYRNNQLFTTLIKSLAPDTRLTIAIDLTGATELITTKTVKTWQISIVTLPKTPAVFLFLA